MTTTSEQAAALSQMAPAVKELHPDAQVKAVEGLIGKPDSATTNLLWTILVPGLVVLVGVSIVAVVVLLLDGKSADQAVTAFSALLAGLLGLFTPSPASQKEGQ
ncbi:MAG TPA: hypothetical protein VGH58_06450 [Solirubrobacterales bacterium]|jgi:uncharacterized membrane protein YcjF (UPF0283 family)